MSRQETIQSDLKDALAPVLRVVKELNGHFVFSDGDGGQFVIVSKEEFDSVSKEERQLTLPAPDTVAEAIRKNFDDSVDDEIIDKVNQDISLAYMREMEEKGDDQVDIVGDELEEDLEAEGVHIERGERPSPPPVRVQFEPIKGDISPDLQE